jgi:thioredoxin-related protein
MSKLLLVVIYFFILLSFKINALDSQNIKSAAEKPQDNAYPIINSQEQGAEKSLSPKEPEIKSEQNTDTTFVLNEKISLSKIMEIDQDDILLGNKEAKIIIFEYSSPTCPHCSHFRKMLFPQIIKNYIL